MSLNGIGVGHVQGELEITRMMMIAAIVGMVLMIAMVMNVVALRLVEMVIERTSEAIMTEAPKIYRLHSTLSAKSLKKISTRAKNQ